MNMRKNIEVGSEYIYESDKGSTSFTSHDYDVEGDDYVLPARDRNYTFEIRPRKAEKGNEGDIYDDYNLANNSGSADSN